VNQNERSKAACFKTISPSNLEITANLPIANANEYHAQSDNYNEHGERSELHRPLDSGLSVIAL